MDNRLQEAIEVAKQIKKHEENNTIIPSGYSKITIPALQTLISYAEQGLKLEGVMPAKKKLDVLDDMGESIGYNQAIDDYTHALIQKLDGLEDLILKGLQTFGRDVKARDLAIFIKEWLP